MRKAYTGKVKVVKDGTLISQVHRFHPELKWGLPIITEDIWANKYIAHTAAVQIPVNDLLNIMLPESVLP